MQETATPQKISLQKHSGLKGTNNTHHTVWGHCGTTRAGFIYKTARKVSNTICFVNPNYYLPQQWDLWFCFHAVHYYQVTYNFSYNFLTSKGLARVPKLATQIAHCAFCMEIIHISIPCWKEAHDKIALTVTVIGIIIVLEYCFYWTD